MALIRHHRLKHRVHFHHRQRYLEKTLYGILTVYQYQLWPRMHILLLLTSVNETCEWWGISSEGQVSVFLVAAIFVTADIVLQVRWKAICSSNRKAQHFPGAIGLSYRIILNHSHLHAGPVMTVLSKAYFTLRSFRPESMSVYMT